MIMSTSLKPRPVIPVPREESDSQGEQLRALSPVEVEWKQRIYDRLLKVLDLSLLATLGDAPARSQIRDITTRLFVEESAPLSLGQRQFLVRRIEDEVMGNGPLEPLLKDPTISDILVNGPHSVYIERRGKLELTDVRFNDEAHLLNIIDRIVSAVGRRIDESSPMVDARLKDGSRVNAIIPPLAIDGPLLSIRRFAVELLTAEDLVKLGAMDENVSRVLQAVVRARLNVVVSGGTGAGKTTLLNILSSFIPADERIVTIEDSAELQLRQPHVARLETRPANIEGKGEVTSRDLVRNSLRMRPERIIVGEVRGAEALDMLQAMNTGHDGSLTTVHANTPRDALSRIETMVSMTGIAFPIKALRAQMASAINVVVQVARNEDGRRRVVSLQEINGMEGEIITMSELFRFERSGMGPDGRVMGQLRATGIVPVFCKRLQERGIELPVSVFSTPGTR
jgi:pilus assembly protein CpaF